MKRRAVKLVMFLLAGAIINVAVAWGCALRIDLVDLTSSEPEDLSQIDSDISLGWNILRYRTPASLCIAAMVQLYSVDAISIDDPRVPEWSRIRQLPAYKEGDPMPIFYDVAYGCPKSACGMHSM
jgi:hypothetical protein